jgi:peptidyl-prolyl cis-trans isomerase SurA
MAVLPVSLCSVALGISAVMVVTPAHAQAQPPANASAKTVSYQPIDRIEVIINDDIVTRSELNRRIVEVKREIADRHIIPPPDDVLRKQVLERMVLESVQLQEANKEGIRVTDQDVEQAMKDIAERNHMTPEAFRETLQRVDVSLDWYRKQLRDRLLIDRLLERDINSQVTVTDTEVDDFLASRQHEHADESYNLSHIFIGIPESATPEQVDTAKRKTEEIHKALEQGTSFEQEAVAYSQGQEALKGGALGWKTAGQLPTTFVEAIQDLKPGEITAVIRSPIGFHILKLNDRRTGVRALPVTQTHVRQILMRPSELQSISEVKARLERLRQRALDGENFADLAREYSEDTASAVKGGDLGWLNPGQTVPEFERAMSALAPNEISEPIQTPFGIQIIQVLGRRQHDISAERERDAAREQIHARKADELFQRWLRRLRDEAYIEYKTDTGS